MEVLQKVEALVDGAVRRGTDVEPFCLGTRGYDIGRTALFGLRASWAVILVPSKPQPTLSVNTDKTITASYKTTEFCTLAAPRSIPH